MRLQIFTLFFSMSVVCASAQNKDKLFGTTAAPESKSGFIINANGDFDFPGADMAKRFGYSYRVGPQLLYKTKSNFLFGAKCDFILGGTVKQDSLMINIRDRYSTYNTHEYEFINNQGERIGVPVYERGYAIGLTFGKILAYSKQHPNDGLTLLGTVGFMQHKIDIFDKDKSVPQLSGDYLKGYDRLTNGLFLEAYVGYSHFAKNKLINYTIGLDGMFGFTQGRRDYLYDVMRTDNAQRLDILFGIRGGWFIPIFKHKSEELLFE